MDLLEQQASSGNVEHTKIKIYHMFTRCLKEMEKMVEGSGLTMRDVGIDVGKYNVLGDSYIVELKMHI
jgi:hypothetical protein